MQAQTIVGLDQILQPQFQGATYWAAVVSPGQCSCSNHCFWKRALRKSAAGSPAWCQRSDSVHVPHMKSRRYKHCKHPRWVSTKSLPSSLEGLRTKKKTLHRSTGGETKKFRCARRGRRVESRFAGVRRFPSPRSRSRWFPRWRVRRGSWGCVAPEGRTLGL